MQKSEWQVGGDKIPKFHHNEKTGKEFHQHEFHKAKFANLIVITLSNLIQIFYCYAFVSYYNPGACKNFALIPHLKRASSQKSHYILL